MLNKKNPHQINDEDFFTIVFEKIISKMYLLNKC